MVKGITNTPPPNTITPSQGMPVTLNFLTEILIQKKRKMPSPYDCTLEDFCVPPSLYRTKEELGLGWVEKKVERSETFFEGESWSSGLSKQPGPLSTSYKSLQDLCFFF